MQSTAARASLPDNPSTSASPKNDTGKIYIGRGPGVSIATLKAACGYGDAGEPVITIMLPEED